MTKDPVIIGLPDFDREDMNSFSHSEVPRELSEQLDREIFVISSEVDMATFDPDDFSEVDNLNIYTEDEELEKSVKERIYSFLFD